MRHLAQNAVAWTPPMDKIVERISFDAAGHLLKKHVLDCESVIEEVFFIAMLSVLLFDSITVKTKQLGLTFDTKDNADQTVLYIERQIHVGWTADFVFTHAGKTLIVECDGHDYHERTKEQAARDRSRDRAAQASGATIFRFTGSEIYRDPCACADQVRAWVGKNWVPA